LTNSPIEPVTKVKTKIIATLGPASDSDEKLTSLLRAGVDVFRLNMAHAQADWRNQVVRRIRDAADGLDRSVGILADLGGPKIRLGPIAGGSVQCDAGMEFQFVGPGQTPASPRELTSTYASLVSEINPGDLILLADGTVSMRVRSKAGDRATCQVEQAGEIRSGSGINLPGVELRVEALTDRDRDDIRWAAEAKVDFVGLSFVQRARDVQQLRDELNKLQCRAQIVAKIEKPQAVAALDDIISVSDAVMVARGDLGVEIDVARVPTVQKQIIRRCQRARIPVITATQMLESMRSNRLPTRAEATDVANAILDGSDAVMLSGETAMGQFPVEAVAMMSRIAREAETILEPKFGRESATCATSPDSAFTESLVEAASRLADQVQAKLMVVATRSGNTAKVLSKQRSRTPIIGISDDAATVQRLNLYWGVTPRLAPRLHDNRELVEYVAPWALRHELVTPGDRVVFIASTNWTGTGHNTIVVHEVREQGTGNRGQGIEDRKI
jgi:pyruvate kinase